MKQELKKRLYFTDDFSPENVEKLQSEGYVLRKTSAYHESDTLEACSEVAGDVPQAYLDLIKRTGAEIVTIEAKVSITPELQAVIDEAKAECEKVVAENDQLKEQITVMEQASKVHSDLIAEHSRLNDLLQISDNTNQVSLEQLQAAKGEFIAFQNDVVAMKKRIAELEPVVVDKKPTAAEVKASKAEQPKE